MTRINKIWATILLSLTSLFIFAPVAFAGDGASGEFSHGSVAIAIGLGLGLAAGLGALAQGRAAAAAFEGMARNPSAGGRLFTSLILALALIESLVIYSLVISFLLLGKIPG